MQLRDRTTSRRLFAAIVGLVIAMSVLAVLSRALADDPSTDPADHPSGSGGGFGG